MTMVQLQDILGDQINTVNDLSADVDDADRKKAYDKADVIARLAKQMINNADVILRTDKLAGEGKLSDSTIQKVVGE